MVVVEYSKRGPNLIYDSSLCFGGSSNDFNDTIHTMVLLFIMLCIVLWYLRSYLCDKQL